MSSASDLPKKGLSWPDLRVWSIGIYSGSSPLNLAPFAHNPVISARDVTDVDAKLVADPFMIRRNDAWHMYFEVLPKGSDRGVIGLAASRDGFDWDYQGVVLEEPFHLSYPCVFDWKGAVYMAAETLDANAVRLYEANPFPHGFQPVCDLVQGAWADPTIFFHAGSWWMFACSTPFEHRTLHLFFAEELRGPWHPHPQNPIVADNRSTARPAGKVVFHGGVPIRFAQDCLAQQHNRSTARPAGKVVFHGGVPIRFAQDCLPRYGTQVRAFEITLLSRQEYSEREFPDSPVLKPEARGWNSVGMHHVDAHQLDDGRWLACVDGDRFRIPGAPDRY